MKEEIQSDVDDQEEDNSKCKQKNRGRKRKRKPSDSSSDEEAELPENSLEVEKNLHASAIKNNLDDVSVKKILKKVVTNDHVLALVKLREEEEESNAEENLRPKLTRAKAKELMKASPQSAPWNLELTPIKHIPVKTRPEVKALIAQELPDDEDDEEYEPTHDDVPSDDDNVLESSSDMESLPRTPGTPRSLRKSSPKVVKDGPFKVPQDDTAVAACRKLVLKEGEEATIALRTRSKLSLSATSIEHIESSFVPPDELPVGDVDVVWNDFLMECLNPGPNTRNEDDDEADPEYNVAADPDAVEADEEALDNNIFKISKKELNDLVAELFSIIPKDATDEVSDKIVQDVFSEPHQPHAMQATTSRWEGKQEPPSDDEHNANTASIDPAPLGKRDEGMRFSIGKTEPQDPLQDEQAYNYDKENGFDKDMRENSSMDPSAVSSGRVGDPPNLATVKAPSPARLEAPPPAESVAAPAGSAVAPVGNAVAPAGSAGAPAGNAVAPAGSAGAPAGNAVAPAGSAGAPAGSAAAPVEGAAADKECPAVEAAPPALLRCILPANPSFVCIQVKDAKILPEQVLLLQQQLRQHVQLAASNFLQLYVHPQYWERARTYKDFLVSLSLMTKQHSRSVVNVCNLKPALELITSWEDTVSEDTPENIEMVRFIENELERSRRRVSQNALYVGEFPSMFMQVVANSNVFVYPYLLPAIPYRDESSRKRLTFLRPVDELLALGLEQFLQYVEANPELYKLPPGGAKAGGAKAGGARAGVARFVGLNAASQLVAEHMLPWLQPRSLLTHITHVRRHGESDNPLKKFFLTKRVEPVKHKLLPFNPKLTLYEQPEHEVPRIWIRYLAKTSNRFKNFLYRRIEVTGQPPPGVDFLNSAEILQMSPKNPRPIDFKEQLGGSINIIRTSLDQTKPDENTANNSATAPNVVQSPLIVSKLYTVVNTSNGSMLVPLNVDTKTINTTDTPICTPKQGDDTTVTSKSPDVQSNDVVEGTKTAEINTPQNASEKVTINSIELTNNKSGKQHCLCCILLKKICRLKQKTILEYFKKSVSISKQCCIGREYPNITNRLKHFLKYYKIHSQCVFRDLHDKLKSKEGEATSEKTSEIKIDEKSTLINDDSDDDVAEAELFFMKLTMRSAIVKNYYVKRRIYNLFSKLDPVSGDVLKAADQLYMICGVELVDMYKEFLGFLNPRQADQIHKFKDYFVQHCMSRLAKKIEEEVSDRERRCGMLSQLSAVFYDKSSSACQLCCGLLSTMGGYPALARYVFSLFPHRHGDSPEENVTNDKEDTVSEDTHEKDVENKQPECEASECEAPMDYEADHSASEEEGEEQNEEVPLPNSQDSVMNDIGHVITVKNDKEINTLQVTQITMTTNEEDDSDSSAMSMLIMSEDEASMKNEAAEWKREEDKLILEALKEHIAPEERKDRTILEIIEEKRVLAMITQSLPHKSMADVKERIIYLLQMLV